jgi:hypothetical protein
MLTQWTKYSVLAMSCFTVVACHSVNDRDDKVFEDKFSVGQCEFKTTGRNDYFILEPGHAIYLADDDTRIEIKVSGRTRMVDGIVTRIVEEREWKNGELYEVAMNYFAICDGSKDVYYFGEEVDFYKDGKIVSHEGAWLAGVNGNKFGLFMPGKVEVGMKFHQEVAPNVAMDRAEVIEAHKPCNTAKRTFHSCVKTRESTPLDKQIIEYKYFAKGIGLIKDDELEFSSYKPAQ